MKIFQNSGCGPGEDCVKIGSDGLWIDTKCRYRVYDGRVEKYICGPTGKISFVDIFSQL